MRVAVGMWLGMLGACQVAALPWELVEPVRKPSPLLGRGTLTVMTRRLSVGVEPTWVLSAPTPAELQERAGVWVEHLGGEALRAQAQRLAEEVQQARPHLVGLQEVWQVRRQSPGDRLLGGSRVAEQVVTDALSQVLRELEVRGLRYRVAVRGWSTQLELPVRAGTGFDDVRLLDSDVVLVSEGVGVGGSLSERFRAALAVQVAGLGPVELRRGCVSVEASVEGRTYRFVSTHLEQGRDEEGLLVQQAQAKELVAALHGEPLPVVLAGSFHSPANLGLIGAPTYRELLLAGYVDVWARRLGAEEEGPGPRVELVLVRHRGLGHVGLVQAWDLKGGGTPVPLSDWLLEQRGLVARLRLPQPLTAAAR